MQVLHKFDDSRFWLRLDDLSSDKSYSGDKESLDHLKASVRKVANRAKWINSQVCRYMPQYTLHEERHFLNVLGIMDALVPDDVIGRLTPLECALPILAAYTHDLGMALSEEEKDNLFDESTEKGKHFASYRTRFDEELRQLERWQKRHDELLGKDDDESRHEAAQAKKRIDAIEGHILASYLRDTHTEDEQVRRLRRWLDDIKKEVGDDNVFRYGVKGKDFQRELALIGISHGRGAPWLRRQLIDGGPDGRFFQPVATGESANLAFPGLLLRLADVMDFDASRAPRILFKHFGIENDQSVLEWNKHLSIVGWRLDVDPDGKQQPDLLYSAECQHPVHEKAIREFKTWIDAELSAVRIELDAQRRQLPRACHWHPASADPQEHGQDARATHLPYDLHLPSQTRLDIRPARDPLTDQPKYVYYDLQFRLDQDEIQQLLMGESLYGDPSLCIRELLQNALDALELRELRLKMKQKGEAREPVDGELIRPGWVREPDGREEELRVTLDWGTDEETGQQWLRVTDNGVGMTEEVIKNYFTQIGKSYFRSPEFNQERAAMKAAGEVVSPISVFGIGFLSCFMIADRIQVRTRPGGDSGADRCAFDITVSGPSSLFWLQAGTLKHQGTEITLYTKPRFRLEHDEELFLKRLRQDYDYSDEYPADIEHDSDLPMIDPPYVIATHFTWPSYPLVVKVSALHAHRIDSRFHADILDPLDNDKISKVAEEWGCEKSFLGTPRWESWDWHDNEGEEATGSAVRLWFPCHYAPKNGANFLADPSDGKICRVDELAAIVADQPEWTPEPRRLLIHGGTIADSYLPSGLQYPTPRVGTKVWIDLRGNAAPSLSANKKETLWSADEESWKRTLSRLFQRAAESFDRSLATVPLSATRNALSGYRWTGHFPLRANLAASPPGFDLLSACTPSWRRDCRRREFRLFESWFFRSVLNDGSLSQYEKNQLSEVLLNTEGELHEALAIIFAGGGDEASGLDSTDIPEALERLIDVRDAELEFVPEPHSIELTKEFETTVKHFDTWSHSSSLQHAFFPDLASSWPVFSLFWLKGYIGDSTLAGPGLVEFAFESDGRTVHFADPQGETPMELAQRGYDLTFPMTAVPLGQLRRECAAWRTDPWYRVLGVAPFVSPSLHDLLPEQPEFLQNTFRVPHIYCLLPRFELWSKRFSDWTDADWHDPENLSALWDLSGHLTGTPGQVLWTRGTHHIDDLPKVGLPAPEFLEANS